MNKLQLIISEVINENAAGNFSGAGGTFGEPQIAATQFSADTYAKGDSRTAKPLGKGVIRRTFPPLTMFALGAKGKSRKRKHKKKK